MPESAYKRCTKCGEDKPLEAFYREKRSRDGRKSECAVCARARKKKWLASPENHARYLAELRDWRKRNPDKIKALYEASWRRDREKQRERNPEKIRARRAVKRAIDSGRLLKPDRCERCAKVVASAPELHGHHKDYAEPLVVEWLCRDCHYFIHSRAKEQNDG